MGDKSAIEWTDASWSPIRARNRATGAVGWHCTHASPGCVHCYAESMNKRLGTGLPFKPGHEKEIEIFLDEAMLLAPLRWKRPRKVFVCSMTDLFAEFVKDEWIDKVFAVMALAPQHRYQILTKRAARMRAYVESKRAKAPEWVHFPSEGGNVLLPYEGGWPTFIWLGVSAEDQARADERIPDLLATPAAVRFVSYEPALGPIDFRDHCNGHYFQDWLTGRRWHESGDDNIVGASDFGAPRLDWIIAGGESGPGARPMHPDWARSARDQCKAAGVAFFFKQWGESIGVEELFRSGHRPGFSAHDRCQVDEETDTVRVGKKAAGRLLDGIEHNDMPPEAR